MNKLSLTILPIAILIVALGLSACDINESMRSKSGNQSGADVRLLAAKNGCMGCHAVKTSVMGPAWELVAERYQDLPGAKSLLMASVVNGSNTNWVEQTGGRAMPAHPDISQGELEQIIDYILTLKQQKAQ